MHNSSLVVTKGEKVKQGQIISRIGTTGDSTGPHIHFEVFTMADGGLLSSRVTEDPLKYLNLEDPWSGKEFDNSTYYNEKGFLASKEFYYNGMPKAGGYLATLKPIKLFFNMLKDALDYLVGLITLALKAAIIGWVRIIESMLTNVVQGATGMQLDENLTVETIIFNKVPLLDVNIFNFATAGGYELPVDSVLYIIRENVSIWYSAFRNITIIRIINSTYIYWNKNGFVQYSRTESKL